MATMTRVYLQLRDLTGGTFDGPENTVVQVSWPVPRVTDEAVPEVLVMRTVQGTIDATGTLVDATLAEGLEVLDPNDATVTPHGYTLTITVMPQDGRPAWIAYAVLSTPRTGGGYDLAANMTVPDTDGKQWFKGDTGPAGQGIAIKGHVTSWAALPATGNEPGDAYIADDTGNLWVWTGTAWSDVGPFQGPTGTAATITIDPASGGVAHGTPTSVTNTGTASAAILKFLIEQAADGAAGSQILTGTGTPTGTPPDKSLYLDTGNGDVWQYSAGAWSGAPILNIKGAAGSPGSPTAFELRGSGSPEGVVTAPPGTYYTDSAGTNGAWRWLKTSGTGATGWVVVAGDTGWRNIGSASLAAGNTTTAYLCRVNSEVFLQVVSTGTDGKGGMVPLGTYAVATNVDFRGFLGINLSTAWPSLGGTSTNAGAGSLLTGTVAIGFGGTNNIFGTVRVATTGSGELRPNGTASWRTTDAWPSTLPGTPA